MAKSKSPKEEVAEAERLRVFSAETGQWPLWLGRSGRTGCHSRDGREPRTLPGRGSGPLGVSHGPVHRWRTQLEQRAHRDDLPTIEVAEDYEVRPVAQRLNRKSKTMNNKVVGFNKIENIQPAVW